MLLHPVRRAEHIIYNNDKITLDFTSIKFSLQSWHVVTVLSASGDNCVKVFMTLDPVPVHTFIVSRKGYYLHRSKAVIQKKEDLCCSVVLKMSKMNNYFYTANLLQHRTVFPGMASPWRPNVFIRSTE
jgi:hypothetical protein